MLLYLSCHRPPRAFLVVTHMATAFLITFRETLEASLVVAIVLTVIDRMHRDRLRLALWNGVGLGVLCSIVIAVIVAVSFRRLPEHLEPLAEGLTMLAASALIVWLIIWVSRTRGNVRQHITQEASEHADAGSWWGIFSMAFFAVVREGTETVLFLQASVFQAKLAFSSIGAVTGVVLALGFTLVLFRGFRAVPLHWIFRVTTVLLVIFALSLAVEGVGEVMEALMV